MTNNEELRPAIERMKICIQCEHFWKFTKQCALCKCFMPVKVRLPGQVCPIKKW
jgi:hypothetical protein